MYKRLPIYVGNIDLVLSMWYRFPTYSKSRSWILFISNKRKTEESLHLFRDLDLNHLYLCIYVFLKQKAKRDFERRIQSRWEYLTSKVYCVRIHAKLTIIFLDFFCYFFLSMKNLHNLLQREIFQLLHLLQKDAHLILHCSLLCTSIFFMFCFTQCSSNRRTYNI